MRRMRKLVLFVLLGIVFSIAFMTQRTENQEPDFTTIVSSSEDEMRGIWVASVLNLDYPVTPTSSAPELRSQIDEILSNVEEWGFNAVFLQVSPCADALYKSEIYPWSVYLTGQQGRASDSGFDPLEYWVSQSHKHGLELHAWINPFRVTREPADWNSLVSDSQARQHPEWVVEHDENYYFNPAYSQVRRMIVDVAMEIVKNYEVDGIHLDDYFYPGRDFDDAAAFAAYGKGFTDIGDWRRNNINSLIYEMSVTLHNYDSELQFGIAPNAVWAERTQREDGSDTSSAYTSYYDLYADTKYWVEAGWLDYIAPQIYYEAGHEKNDFTVLLDWWTDVVFASGGGYKTIYRTCRLQSDGSGGPY